MARWRAVGRTGDRERPRGAVAAASGQARRDPARSDDARDGWLCGRGRPAEGAALARHSGHRDHSARPRCQGPRALELGRAIGTGQGDVPARGTGRAYPPAGAEQASSRQRNGSSVVTKVLYVEDNDDNVYMLKMRLELLNGFEVVTAEDGEKGCAMALSEHPDIILMDLEMPGVDGWEATRRLKANPQTRDIPIIALSAHALAGSREKALAAGCDEFDTKPVEFERLVATLRRLLANHK